MTRPRPPARLAALAAALLLGAGAVHALDAQPVGDALARPALAVQRPERGVMLGAARAGERIVAVGERGLIVVSDDGGARWRQVASPVSVTLTTVRFADAQRGVAVGHGGAILTTADGGLTWTLRLDGRRLARMTLDAAIAGGDAAQIKAAERLVADGPDKPLLDVAILDGGQRMLAVGAYGLAALSSDGGATWQPWMDRLPNPRGRHLYMVRRHGPTLLAAGEQGLLLRSDDGGASFRPLESPYRGSWFAGAALDSGDWVIAGLRGNAWASSDGGASWRQLAVPVPASITAVERGDDGALLFASQSGQVLKLDGDRLAPLAHRTPQGPLTGLLDMTGGRLLTLGFQGLAADPAPRH